MVMSSTHPQVVSRDELAIIRQFGKHYRRTHDAIMTIGELLPGAPGAPVMCGAAQQWRHRNGINRLMDRGWLVTSSTVHWDKQSDCMLLGEGLKIARQLAGEGLDPMRTIGHG